MTEPAAGGPGGSQVRLDLDGIEELTRAQPEGLAGRRTGIFDGPLTPKLTVVFGEGYGAGGPQDAPDASAVEAFEPEELQHA